MHIYIVWVLSSIKGKQVQIPDIAEKTISFFNATQFKTIMTQVSIENWLHSIQNDLR